MLAVRKFSLLRTEKFAQLGVVFVDSPSEGFQTSALTPQGLASNGEAEREAVAVRMTHVETSW
jgi:hypothetical protein